MNESTISSISKGDAGAEASVQLELIQNVAVNISVEVGRSSLRIRDLLRLGQGSVVELDRVAGEPLDEHSARALFRCPLTGAVISRASATPTTTSAQSA